MSIPLPPLPRPGSLGLIQYAGVDMLSYAAAVSADARRTAEYWKAEHSAGNERIKVLEDVLRMALAELDELPVWWSNTGHVCNAARAALGDAK